MNKLQTYECYVVCLAFFTRICKWEQVIREDRNSFLFTATFFKGTEIIQEEEELSCCGLMGSG